MKLKERQKMIYKSAPKVENVVSCSVGEQAPAYRKYFFKLVNQHQKSYIKRNDLVCIKLKQHFVELKYHNIKMLY